MVPLTQGARQNLEACSAMIGLTALAVVSRVVVRLTHNQALQGSDWLCLISLALFYAQCGLIIDCKSLLQQLIAVFMYELGSDPNALLQSLSGTVLMILAHHYNLPRSWNY